jgi:hypothetical protein
VEALANDMPEPSAYPVAGHRAADRAADGEAHQGRLIDVISADQMENQARPPCAFAGPDGRREVRAPPHPMGGRQHDA